MTGLKYFFTNYGDVYSGYEYPDTSMGKFRIIIQGTKKKDYEALTLEEKTLEKISEHGWALNPNVIKKIEDENFNPPKWQLRGDSWSGYYDRKVMFIFGAGASANCVYGSEKKEFNQDPLRPPLGPALFDKRFKAYFNKYKGVKQSLHFLQDDNANVEEFFEHEWKNISLENNQAVLSRHINIQYYLQEVLKDVSSFIIDEYSKNLYSALANKLQKIYSASIVDNERIHSSKRFAFVSFNQDTILETFLQDQFNHWFSNIDDYANINESPFCVFKPHGSWNWGWEFPEREKFNNKTADWLFENKISLFQLYYELLGNYVDMIDWANTFGTEFSIHRHNLGKFTIDKSQLKIIDASRINDFYPGLLLPYRDKDEFIMPLKHFYTMQSYFSYLETLVIVGWKGNEEAFNRQLLQHSKNLKKIIIADPNHEIVEENLKDLFLKHNITPIIYKDFEDFVLNGVEKELNES
ncbi:MAG TPA: hypothetical protein PLN13_03415 [Bacteroidia bacterium]|nr:hypothetical protein [Bacteroidia bacterium]HRH07603.1 hypothetical protein [Bacteroidia bacterium]